MKREEPAADGTRGAGVSNDAIAPGKGGVEPAHALTFFLTARERAAVVKELRRLGAERERALLRALRLEGADRKHGV